VGETRLLDAGLEALAPEDDELLVKCTGRLGIGNLDACFPSGAVPRLQVLLNSRLVSADSRCWAATAGVWRERLTGLGGPMAESGDSTERALALATLRAVADGVPLTRFPRLPRWEGRSGSHGHDYDSPRERARQAVHEGVRRVAHRAHFTL
jgi:hypothetical protein